MNESFYSSSVERHDASFTERKHGLSANSSPNLPPPRTHIHDVRLNQHARTPSAGSGPPHHSLPSSSPRSILQETPSSQQAPPVLYSDASRSILTPSTPAPSASPRFATLAPPVHWPTYTPNDRSLPSKGVSDETIDEAFAAFILYCNPMFPITSDTTELRKAFRSPPKSDGNSFSTFTLFQLIRRFEMKDIKTWTQLALELGVEPPSTEKGQSTQKVQQYTVRLKRWMRAMHIDAFFEYLLGKHHVYFNHVPPPDAPLPDSGRDNVPLEEDLAIRAIDPTFRPKRGRRKIEEMDEEHDRNAIAANQRKRPYLDTSVTVSGPQNYTPAPSAFVDSGLPMTAQAREIDRYTVGDLWSANSAVTPDTAHIRGLAIPSAVPSATSQNFRWRVQDQTPTTPHPLSAVTPASGLPPDSAFDEPRSAVTPKSRSRRRHGPAVSSAWSSSNATPGGKLRGRPPSNRSVRDGPFVTFPANPNTKEAPVIEIGRTSTPTSTPVSGREESAGHEPLQRYASEPTTATAAAAAAPSSQPLPPTRGERLSLQVPQNVGRPVHLVTPPTLLLSSDVIPAADPNIPSSTMSSTRSTPQRELTMPLLETQSARDPPQPPRPPSATRTVSASAAMAHHTLPPLPPLPSLPPAPPRMHSPAIAPATAPAAPGHAAVLPTPTSLLPGFSTDDIQRALAADLIRADVSGRPRDRARLQRDEPKLLAAALLSRLHRSTTLPFEPPPRKPTPVPSAAFANSADEVTKRLAAATVLGVAPQLGVAGGVLQSGRKRIAVRRFRRGDDGYEVPLDPDERFETLALGVPVREEFDIAWTLNLGALAAEVQVKGLVVPAFAVPPPGPGMGNQESMELDAGTEAGDAETWRRRFLEMKEALQRKEEEVERLKGKVLDAVL